MTQEKKTIEIDLNEVKFFDLNERPVRFGDLNDHIGNTIFLNARTVPMSEAGASIHKTGKAEVGIQDLIIIIATIESDEQTTLLLKSGVSQYLKLKLAELTNPVEKIEKEIEEVLKPSKEEVKKQLIEERKETIDHKDLVNKVKDGVME